MALNFELTPQDDTWNQAVGEAELGAPITESVEVIALEGNDTVTGTSFNDLLLGNQGGDSLDGGAGDDIVYGGQGNDFVTSASGNNLLLGNLGDDTIIGGTGNDTIFGGQDNDSIEATAGDNEIYGNLGDDIIIGGTGNDYIHGGQGNDTIEAGTGATKTLIGGLGDDTFVFAAGTASGAMVYGNLSDGAAGTGNDTILVTGNNDFSNTSFDNISTISVDEGVTAEGFSLSSLIDSVTTLEGEGTIQINASNNAVRAYLDSLGENLGADVTILDEDDNVVTQTPPFVPDNPNDPDKERPIQGNFTIGVDNLVFSGRANAPLDNNNGNSIFTVPTLETGDTARGAGESDVLTATLGSTTSDFTNPPVAPQLDGIEVLNFTSVGAFAGPVGPIPTFIGTRTTGTNTVVVSDSTQGITIDELRNNVDLVLRNHINVGNDVTIGFNPAVADPAINIRLENVRSAGSGLVIDHGFDTFNIVSTQVEGFDGAVTNQLGGIRGDTPTTVNIAGDQNLTLFELFGPSLPDSVTTINAGGDPGADPVVEPFSGNLVINQLPDSDLAITGGSGDDFFGFGDTFDQNDTPDGGDGEDTLSATLTIIPPARTPLIDNLDNIEVLELDTEDLVGGQLYLVDGISGNVLERVILSSAGSVDIVRISNSEDEPTITTIDASDVAGRFVGASNDLAPGAVVTGGQGNSTFNATGNVGGVEIIGQGGNDIFTGGNGADTITGGAGNDTLFGSDGGDSITGGAGNDSLEGDEGNDILDGGDGNDIVNGGDGDDTMTGAAGNDIIDGDAGNDVINDTAGNNFIDGGAGNDRITTGAGNDSIQGGAGNDVINTGNGANIVDGGAGNDIIDGGTGRDVIFSGTGNDIIDGNAGDDIIVSEGGNNIITGGEGSDVFVITGPLGTQGVELTDFDNTEDVGLAASTTITTVNGGTTLGFAAGTGLAIRINTTATLPTGFAPTITTSRSLGVSSFLGIGAFSGTASLGRDLTTLTRVGFGATTGTAANFEWISGPSITAAFLQFRTTFGFTTPLTFGTTFGGSANYRLLFFDTSGTDKGLYIAGGTLRTSTTLFGNGRVTAVNNTTLLALVTSTSANFAAADITFV